MSLALYQDTPNMKEGGRVINNANLAGVQARDANLFGVVPSIQTVQPEPVQIPLVAGNGLLYANSENLFQMVGGRLFVDCNFVISNKEEAISVIQSRMRQTKLRQYRTTPLERSREHYQWTPLSCLKFAVAALAFGIKTVTPKQLLSVLDDKNLNREKVASHLQKFRISVAKQNHINIADIKNTSLPKNFQHTMISYVNMQWYNPEFQGFDSSKIREMVAQLQ